MSIRWWGFIIVCFGACATAIWVGYRLDNLSDFENSLLATGAGIAFALGIAILLIEGPILTRDQRRRTILKYRKDVCQACWDTSPFVASETANFIGADFEPRVDLDGDEREKWETFVPVLRKVFDQARLVPRTGLPAYPDLANDQYFSILESGSKMVERIQKKIGTDRDMQNQVYPVLSAVHHLGLAVQRGKEPYFVEDLMSRYEAIGIVGDAVLDVAEAIPAVMEREI